MTAPQPATPGGDSVREELVDLLAHRPIGSGYYATTVGIDEAQEMADVLVPLVDRLRAEAKAEEVQRIYQAVDDECQVADPPNYEEDDYAAGYLAGLGFAADFIGTPAARAAAYRTPNPSKETQP